MDLAQRLQQGLVAMGLSQNQGPDQDQAVDENQRARMIEFIALLDKWNQAFNLSAVRDPEQMVSRHLLDSLSLLPRLRELKAGNSGFRILDVGTGPGLPGIPLALCLPDVDFVLLDSNGKKTRFVFQALMALGLDNVKVENTRIESYQSPRQLDIVVSRAFASLNDFVTGCEHLCAPHTRLLAMKGLYPEEEIRALPANWQVAGAFAVDVPDCEGQRHIIELTQNSTNPKDSAEQQ